MGGVLRFVIVILMLQHKSISLSYSWLE